MLLEVLSIWGWVTILASTMLFFPFEVIVFCIGYFFDPPRWFVGRLFRLSSVLAMKLNPLYKFSVYGTVPPEPKKTVMVSNHLSFADVALISHLPWEMKWLSKSSIFFIPFVGWGMFLAGDIMLWRGDKSSAKSAMLSAANWLKRGANVMIFPEGTRSRTGEMAEFKEGAFRLAIEQQADILPLAVSGTFDSLKPGDWKMNWAVGLVTVGKPISTQGKTMDDVKDLIQEARNQIVKMKEELDQAIQNKKKQE